MFHNGWWDCLAVRVDRYRNTYVYNYMYEFLKFVLCIYGLMCLGDVGFRSILHLRHHKLESLNTSITYKYINH